MGRSGFSGGGRRGGGGGGGGSRPASLSKASRDADGNILIQRAAASNGFRSTWERIWYGPDNSHEDLCKSIVERFEMCVANNSGNREYSWCQRHKRELEEHCAEFKSSWNDWWAKEKKQYCDILLSSYKRCVRSHSKESGECRYETNKMSNWLTQAEILEAARLLPDSSPTTQQFSRNIG